MPPRPADLAAAPRQPARPGTPLLVCLSALLTLLVGGAPPAAEPDPPPGAVCLVLSGGGARGLAHIGVLRVLERQGWRPHCIVGTSAGALVGALYCAGYTPDEIEALFQGTRVRDLVQDTPQRNLLPYDQKDIPQHMLVTLTAAGDGLELPSGLIEGQRILNELNVAFLRRGAGHLTDFDHLPVRFRAVAADLRQGRAHIFRDGSLTTAVRASIAIPAAFSPVPVGDMLLVDGGVVNNVAVDVARAMGYRRVAAVHVGGSAEPGQKALRNIFDILDESFTLAQAEKNAQRLSLADLVIRPEIQDFTVTDFHLLDPLVDRGRAAAERHLDELRALFADSPPTPPQPPRPTWAYALPLTAVGVDGASHPMVRREVMRRGRIRPGQPLTENRMSTGLERIYAMDRFRRVDFDLRYTEGAAELIWKVDERPRTSLSLALRHDNDYQFMGFAQAIHRDLLGTDSEIRLRLLGGTIKDYRLEVRSPMPFYRPLGLRTTAYYTQTPRRVHWQGVLIEMFEDKHVGVTAGSSLNLGRWGALYGSVNVERVELFSRGLFNIEATDHVTSGTFGFGVDTLDRWVFPERGIRFDAHLEKAAVLFRGHAAWLLGRAALDAYLPLGERNTLNLSATTFRGTDLPPHRYTFAGGHNPLSLASTPLPGFQLNELWSEDMLTARLEFRRKFPHAPIGLVDATYLYAQYGLCALREASLRQDGEIAFDTPRRLYHGFGVGVALATTLGPARLFIGAGEGGRWNWTVSVGPEF